MKKPVIAIITLSIIILIGIISVTIFDNVEQNNEFQEGEISTINEPKSGRNFDVHLEETVSMKTNP